MACTLEIAQKESKEYEKAVRLNKKYSQELGWDKHLIEVYAIQSNKSLTWNKFTEEVFFLQKGFGFSLWEQDGIIGEKTYGQIVKKFKKYQQLQLEKTIDNFNYQKKTESINDMLLMSLTSYTDFINTNRSYNDASKFVSNKNITSHAAQLISKVYRQKKRVINSLKVNKFFVKTIKGIGIVGDMAEASRIVMLWEKVDNRKMDLNSKLIIDSYMFILSIIGEITPPTPFSLAAKNVTMIYNFVDVHYQIGEKLNLASDELADFLFRFSQGNTNEMSKKIYNPYGDNFSEILHNEDIRFKQYQKKLTLY